MGALGLTSGAEAAQPGGALPSTPTIVVESIVVPEVPQEGGFLGIGIRVSHRSGGPVGGLLLSNRFPAGVTFLGSAPEGRVAADGAVVIPLGDLAVGGTATAAITGRVSQVVFDREETVQLANVAVVAAPALAEPVRLVRPVSMVVQRDFGDAPDPTFPVRWANDGARHRVSGLYLGGEIDAEVDATATPLARGDDATGVDDEDGVIFGTPWAVGGVALVRVTASLSGVLDVWADFLRNGDWLDAGEHVITGAGVPAGSSILPIPIPAWAALGNCHVRFRLSPGGTPLPTGFAAGGEVEDYVVEITEPVKLDSIGSVRWRLREGRLNVLWDRPNALLQAASELDGRWTTLPEAEDEFEAAPEEGQRFFRLVEGRGMSRSGLARRTLSSMVREADLIVEGVVSEVAYANSTAGPPGSVSWPHAFVTLDVREILKGRIAGSQLCLRILGGVDAADGTVLEVSHSTRFDVGEHSLLFVRRNGHAACPIVGGGAGRLRILNGLVYSDHGHRLVKTASGRVAYGIRDHLDEVEQDVVGTEVISKVHNEPEGEEPRPEAPVGQHLEVADLRTLLTEAIRRFHTPQELGNPVLTVSADRNRPFVVPLPRHRAPPSVAPDAGPGAGEDDEETARVRANGGNPVIRP